MSKRKGRTPRKPPEKAVPPPDNPLLRYQESIESELDSKALAEKRLEALKRTRAMPTSDEEP